LIPLPALRSIVLALSSFLAALPIAGPAQNRAGDAPAATPATEVLSLAPGASLEREIHGGETQTFDVPLDAGTFLLLEISSRNASLSFCLSKPNGETLVNAMGSDPHLLAVIADQAGIYRLDPFAAQELKVPARYSVKILDVRPAAPGDEARVKAALALAEAKRLLALDNDEQAPRAEARLGESIAAWQAAGDPRGEAEALLVNAGFRSDKGRISEALLLYEKALDRSKESGFPEGEARALQGIGFCSSRLEHYEEALRSYRSAAEILRQVGEPFEQIPALEGLANVYWRQRDFQDALQSFEEALALAVESGDLTQQAIATAGVGSANYQLFRFGKARELLEKALELSRQAGDLREEVNIEHNLAAYYQNEGQLQKALDLFIRVADRQAPRDSGMTHYNMGNLYLLLGDPDQALENYLLSQKVFHAAGDAKNEVNALIGVGRVHQEKGNIDAALAEYAEARRLVIEEPWIIPHFIGLSQVDLGQLQEALESLGRALAIASKNNDRPQKAASLLAIGSAYAKLGQAEQAEKSLGDAITEANEIGYRSVVALALLRRSLLRRDKDRLEEALADIESAIAAVESTRRNIAGDQFRTGFFASKRTYYALDIDLLMRLDRLHPGKGYGARALETSERARARGLLDLLAEGRIDLRQGLDRDLQQREDDLSGQISRLQRELRAANVTSEQYQKLRVERDALDARWEQLEVEIQTKNKRYAEVRYPVPLKLEEIQSRILDDHTALLEYALAKEGSLLFVVTREEIKTFALPAAEEITKQVLRLRGALEHESFLKARDYLESAFALYHDLLEPASATLAGKSSLLIVPDGVLYYIPFEALLTAPADQPNYRDLPYLLRRYSIAYIPSASVLAGLRAPRQAPVPADRKQLVAFAPFADPGSASATRGSPRSSPADFAASAFQPLPASRREIEKITELYPGAALRFIGSAADEAAVTGNPAVANARRLHFATHAQIDEIHPEYSALILAERPGEDGLLQMREIFNLKLSADLVVLSACETALGKEVTGEGLVGLTRAFFYAGVPSLVVSLWNVVDGPTPDLMLDFYKNLEHAQEKSKALQASKLSMIGRAKYAHPSYWAPFILFGEPR